jgi:hypothetical protein
MTPGMLMTCAVFGGLSVVVMDLTRGNKSAINNGMVAGSII